MSSKMLRTSLALLALSFTVSCATGPGTEGPDVNTATAKATTKSERASRADDLFVLFDADGDGFLTRSELEKGLRSATNVEPNPNLMMALDKNQKPKKKAKVSRSLSDSQVKRAVEQAFKTGSDKKLEERITREDFRKIVSERPASEGDDPWAPFM